MNKQILEETSVAHGEYQHIVSSFTADTDGVCWLGVYGFVGSYANYLSIDDISLVQEGWHTITVKSEYGTCNVQQGALEGDKVKLTITPIEGYVIDEISILKDTDIVAFNDEDSTFIMPAGDVNVVVTFKSSTGIENVKILDLYTAEGRIYCECDFRIYDLLGRDVTAMNGSLRGAYFVRTKDASRKIIVK